MKKLILKEPELKLIQTLVRTDFIGASIQLHRARKLYYELRAVRRGISRDQQFLEEPYPKSDSVGWTQLKHVRTEYLNADRNFRSARAAVKTARREVGLRHGQYSRACRRFLHAAL